MMNDEFAEIGLAIDEAEAFERLARTRVTSLNRLRGVYASCFAERMSRYDAESIDARLADAELQAEEAHRAAERILRWLRLVGRERPDDDARRAQDEVAVRILQ